MNQVKPNTRNKGFTVRLQPAVSQMLVELAAEEAMGHTTLATSLLTKAIKKKINDGKRTAEFRRTAKPARSTK